MGLNLGDLFGKESAFGQLLIWQVGAQVVGAVMAPGLAELQQLVNETAQTTVLTPDLLADLVVRNYLDQSSAEATAKRSGVSPSDFALMVASAGDAVDVTTLMEGFRRKLIPFSGASPDALSVEAGVREGRLSDKWLPLLEQLGTVPIGVADAVDAVVENQIAYADGESYAYQNGLDPAGFKILVDTRGNPPAPSELSEMVRRGIIPQDGTGPDVVSFQQGISEGATKDKWTKPLAGLQTVLVPEGRVTTLLRVGVIDKATAIGWYQLLGYDQAAAAAFAAEASAGKTTADKQLAKSDVLKLYADAAIDTATATALLGDLGYDAAEAAEILAIQDMHTATTITDSAVTRIRSYYIARKLDSTAVVNALNSLNVPAAQQSQLLAAWDIARTSNLKLLTEAQIADAWEYQIMDTVTAVTQLMGLGYNELDAWYVLSIKNKGPITSAPPSAGPPTATSEGS